MIFVTVGTQLSFDRLVRTVAAWADRTGVEVFVQAGPGTSKMDHLRSADFLTPVEFEDYFSKADLVVAHAGMGSILTALSFGKPIIIMPRRSCLGEHRNDHQLATAAKFATHPVVKVAWDELELEELLNDFESLRRFEGEVISTHAPQSFLDQLRELIDQ